tara:strand:+ start:12900 stop:13592 length:693 start_codon:yes stop_codon:yes gene_type:complete
MAEELEATPPAQPSNDVELKELRESVKRLEQKNAELIGKMQRKELLEVPDDYEQLKEFKRKSEQEKLEQAGEYQKAKDSLEQQYRDRSSSDKQRIEELELRNRELELITPSLQALTEITHDPELVINNFVPKDKLQKIDGKPVIVDGYEQLPIQDFVKNKLEKEKPYLLKTTTISGSGAPIRKPSTDSSVSEEMLKPFLKESFNLTEQSKIASIHGDDFAAKLKQIAENR